VTPGRLHNGRFLWDAFLVKLWSAIRRLLPVLAVLGVVLAPFTASAAAGDLAAPASMAAMAEEAGMAGDMPCCPPEKPVMPDCMKACPLLTVCLGKTIQGVASAAGPLPARASAAVALVPRDDATLHSVSQGPPLRPPQA
jgi:hypothetical protein